MLSEFRVAIADGVSLIIPEGWDVYATGESQEAFEILMHKDGAEACLRMIGIGKKSHDSALDCFKFSLLESLVTLGCLVEPSESGTRQLIIASHPDRPGKILHYIVKSSPLLHFSAGGISGSSETEEFLTMADSLLMDNEIAVSSKDYGFGELVPFTLSKDSWIEQ